MSWWDDIGLKYRKYSPGPLSAGARIWNTVSGNESATRPGSWFTQQLGFGGEQPELDIPTRPPLGPAADQASMEQAQYFQRMLNQNLTQNILPGITQEYGAAGRLRGGRYPFALERAGADTQRLVANATQQGAMERFKALLAAELQREGMDEDRAWRQAQLDIEGGTDYTEIGKMIAQLYLMGGA